MSKALSILIPTMPERADMYDKLVGHLWAQAHFYTDIEILSWSEPNLTIGAKRNKLLREASGKYVAFIDDDDRVSDDYINKLMWGIKLGVDCCSLTGIYTVNGNYPEIFEHSIKYKAWRTTNDVIKYERYPNHLNCIRADIAKQFKFPEVNHGEDHNWAKQIHESGLLKTEHYIDSIIYYYDKRTI